MASVAIDRQYGLADPNGDFPDIRDLHERIGRALMQVIVLTYGTALVSGPGDVPLQTLDDLRGVRQEVLNVTDDAHPVLAQVGDTREIWGFFRFLNEPETPTQIRPSGVPQTDPGMWVRQVLPGLACCGAHRYLARIEYLSTQVSNKMLWDRAAGKPPAVFISLVGESIEEASQTMAFHRLDLRYQIRVISANWRGGVLGRMTSPVAQEAEDDPGSYRVIGDLRRLLISENLLQDTMGVVKTSLGGTRNIEERDKERLILDSMDLRVIAYAHTPNTPCEATDPWQMWIQLQNEFGQKEGGPFVVPRPL